MPRLADDAESRTGTTLALEAERAALLAEQRLLLQEQAILQRTHRGTPKPLGCFSTSGRLRETVPRVPPKTGTAGLISERQLLIAATPAVDLVSGLEQLRAQVADRDQLFLPDRLAGCQPNNAPEGSFTAAANPNPRCDH
jgi:hypothetical protein